MWKPHTTNNTINTNKTSLNIRYMGMMKGDSSCRKQLFLNENDLWILFGVPSATVMERKVI